MGDMSNEPSMEEILSSIKRIIAEDSEAAMSAPRPRRSVARPQVFDDIRKDDDDEAVEAAEPEEVLELTDPVAPDAEEEVQETSSETSPAERKPALVSAAAVDASRSSLAALSALVVKPEVVGGDTLEGLVREMLKPMLAEWLDSRLPDVVERLVAQEISRITTRG